MTTGQRYELLNTVGSLFDGMLAQSDADTMQLAQRLAADPEARAMYVKFVTFDVGLQWSSGALREFEIARLESPITLVSTRDVPSAGRNSANSKKSRAFSVAPFLVKRSFFSRPVLKYVALVALCLYGSFALIAWNLRPDKWLDIAGAESESVASVRNMANVQWSKNASSKSAESSILPGELLQISSGTIELELHTGTKLVVEGPAEWSIDADNRVFLRAGKLLAHVAPQAIDFTVETSTATVVDLGTEFAVEADAAGQTDVEVITGKVDVHYGTSATSNGLRQNVRLSAGQAKRFSKHEEADPVTVVDVKPGTKSWIAKSTSKLADTAKVPRLPGEAKLILSLNAGAGVTNTSSSPAVNGDSISLWADQSGNNNNATKLEAISAPVLRTNTLNSRAVVAFAASGKGDHGQELVISPLTGNVRGQKFTVFLVGKIDGNQAVTATSSDYFFDGVEENSRIALGLNANHKLSFFGNQSIDYLREDFAESTADSSLWTDFHIYEVLYSGASSALFVDGNLTTPVVAGHAGDTAITSMLLGSRYSHNYALKGAIANVQVYVGAISRAQENKIGAALQNYYGISGEYVDVSEAK